MKKNISAGNADVTKDVPNKTGPEKVHKVHHQRKKKGGHAFDFSKTMGRLPKSGLGGSLLVIFIAFVVSNYRRELPKELERIPGPRLTEHAQFQGDHKRRFLWGTYRPGYYFGMRARLQHSPLFGMMWFDPSRRNALQNIRHEAQQSDGLSKYGWLQHDGETFGIQELHDNAYNITTSWVKNLENDQQFQDWGLRVSCSSLEDNMHPGEPVQRKFVSFIFYIATEDGSRVQFHKQYFKNRLKSDIHHVHVPVMNGHSSSPVDGWSLHVKPTTSDHYQQIMSVNGISIRTRHTHNLTAEVSQFLMYNIMDQYERGVQNIQLELPDKSHPGSNAAFLQITAELPFSLDLTFLSEIKENTYINAKQKQLPKVFSSPEILHRLDALSGNGLSKHLQLAKSSFEDRFKSIFGDFYSSSQNVVDVAKAGLSNLLGGIGYWYGNSLVKIPGQLDHDGNPVIRNLWPASLFSATPSRSFFPRGFLWDEGFHLLLVKKWNNALCKDILAHWLDLMTASGWIPREQILGQESRSRVPDEFIPQSPDAANPPTLFLSLAEMAEEVSSEISTKGKLMSRDLVDDAQFLAAAWPRLVKWFKWYNSTQSGSVPGTYRWRGRDQKTQSELNPKTLTSGLDDYPRASHPSDIERHVDLRCWLAFAARSLSSVGDAIKAPRNEVDSLKLTSNLLSDFESLKRFHWDGVRKQFSDWGIHTEDVRLIKRAPAGQLNEPGGEEPRRKVMGRDPYPQFVPHYGYVSLFPLLLQLIPNDATELGNVIEKLRDEKELWTNSGLRSLSANSTIYQKYNTEHDPPYWRGAIWININYLAINALRKYKEAGGPYSVIAGETADLLKSAVAQNIVKQYYDSGYLFEQYDDVTGQGKGCHPFTGWTALLALMGDKN